MMLNKILYQSRSVTGYFAQAYWSPPSTTTKKQGQSCKGHNYSTFLAWEYLVAPIQPSMTAVYDLQSRRDSNCQMWELVVTDLKILYFIHFKLKVGIDWVSLQKLV